MPTVRFIMLGGFLGAGKTTAIARLARHYTDQGLQVGLVTNDQAYDLVDTHSLRSQGFDVGEVPGACFCCKFDDLVDVVRGLESDSRPDVIITEPVGSCTDLVATVLEPLRHLHGDHYELAPLAVLLKPEHGRKILRNEQRAGFSPKAAYIFLKQLEEADVIALNKIDKLSAEERSDLMALIAARFPEKTVIGVSARGGDGFDALISLLDGRHAERPAMEMDYDTYAEGEAELGWLNCQAEFDASHNDTLFSLDELVLEIVRRTARELDASGAETAHLKVLGLHGETPAIANLVSSDVAPELSLESGANARQADIVVNARVAMAPEELERIVRAALSGLAADRGWKCEVSGLQRFRPGRPQPTHRIH